MVIIKRIIHEPIQYLIMRYCKLKLWWLKKWLERHSVTCYDLNCPLHHFVIFTALVKLFWWYAWRDYCAAESKDEAVGAFQERHGVHLIQVDFALPEDAKRFGEEIDEELSGTEFWKPNN